jgi:aminoglycoside phosphotransferase family enzyme
MKVDGVTATAVPGLAAKVEHLSRPASYREHPQRVIAVETHMSWVFLLDRDAYKLKKPAHLPSLDFSTLALREHFCREEVRLNRRLSDDVYVGVVPLALASDGSLALAGTGATIDWLVHMRRLPAERMLDRMIGDGTLSETDVQHVAARLSRFYRSSPTIPAAPAAYLAQFDDGIEACRHELARAAYNLPQDDIPGVCAGQHAAIALHAQLIGARGPRVLEAHGDLRPEHICLTTVPQFIDCLEFAPALRLLDPVDEIAFLALECARLGAPWVAAPLFATYAETSGDAPSPALVAFYQSYRALVRACIAIRHLDDDGVRGRAEWVARTLAYLRLARGRLDLCLAP